MAAALRCAARRLGGSLLQRPKAAVMEERRWFGASLLQQTQAAVVEERHRLLVPSGFVYSRPLSSEAGDVAVRCTARMLGGSPLQPGPTPAAVAEERRRLMPSSRMHSRQLSTERARQTKKEKELRDLLEQRKEELRERIAKREKIHTTTGPPKYIELTVTLLVVILGVMMGLAEATAILIFYLFLLVLIFGDDSKKGEEEQVVTKEENQ